MMRRQVERLILFDIDCTLLWTGGAGRESTRRSMLEVFGRIGALDQHSFGGKTDWQTLYELLQPEGITHEQIAAAMPAYAAAMGRHLAAIIDDYPVRPCPGALPLVDELRQRPDVLIGLITGNVHTAARVKLRAAGFDPAWFPIGAFGDEAYERDDLAPLAYERACRRIGRRLPLEQVIVIGDTPMDVACARAIDAVAVAVGTGFGDLADLIAAGPDHLFDEIGQVRDLLG
ncbi:MAG: HAD family hydrolase [Candidatus Flexifilum sp.]|jgi:phosphoglycolate phosphatase-like HAD superfamily hydrolase